MSLQVFDHRVEVIIDEQVQLGGNAIERDQAFKEIDERLGMHAWFTDRFVSFGLAVWTFKPMTDSARVALDAAVANVKAAGGATNG